MSSRVISSLMAESFLLSKTVKYISGYSPITVFLVAAILIITVVYNRRRARLVRLIEKIPGPKAMPLLGNAVEMSVDHDELFSRLTGSQRMWGTRIGMNKAWQGQTPYVMLFDPETVEPILNSQKFIDKSGDYEYLQPWLGTGLLTSFGRKWHSRRKILTPAFHFKILDDFIDVFNEQSAILTRKLERELDSESFNIFPYVTLCTLDIVCETAMGRSIYAQSNSESDYVKAVYGIGEIVQSRQSKLWLHPDFIFRMTADAKRHASYINTLHGFSNKVIRERKAELRENMNNNNYDSVSDAYDDLGKKKRLAFLDLLIEYSQEGTKLSNSDIREEVDTFMFEGHDTTSAAISWTLFLLGSHPEYQERVVEELESIFGDDRETPATMKNLMDMRYLECCIKDALRLFPSVPMMGRSINEDVQIGDYTVPAGTTAIIMTYMLHRNPRVFPKPEQFNPDNFLPENCAGRHPFAYIPFSAGPRNCIGQKFAILEEKAVISTVLRNYKIEAVDRREDLTLLGELILRPKDGLRVKITRRE
ncbi:cytochrome P450 4c3-like [Musca vetustissima]|uniref:cytochrome P450 4c3-like n=1 Tax=Musca vetustissima TaxID=27455 RepID=UPI002AB7ECEE|nr:cytochrome P450 4c3-like [Musca vetustissima]XP_061401393.1 cytochrome P450 4c3-like [Musca vetustissima]